MNRERAASAGRITGGASPCQSKVAVCFSPFCFPADTGGWRGLLAGLEALAGAAAAEAPRRRCGVHGERRRCNVFRVCSLRFKPWACMSTAVCRKRRLCAAPGNSFFSFLTSLVFRSLSPFLLRRLFGQVLIHLVVTGPVAGARFLLGARPRVLPWKSWEASRLSPAPNPC